MARGIYDSREFECAMVGKSTHIRRSFDRSFEDLILFKEEKEKLWEFVIKMFIFGRDLMVGNPRLAELGFEEEAWSPCFSSWFPRSTPVDRPFLKWVDFMETFLYSEFDWNGIRKPFVFATENDS